MEAIGPKDKRFDALPTNHTRYCALLIANRIIKAPSLFHDVGLSEVVFAMNLLLSESKVSESRQTIEAGTRITQLRLLFELSSSLVNLGLMFPREVKIGSSGGFPRPRYKEIQFP